MTDRPDTTYPTDTAWDFFTRHLTEIRSVVAQYGSQNRMEIPNTRLADRVPGADPEQRDSVVLPQRYSLPSFDRAVEARDSSTLYDIMNDTWLRLPERTSIYSEPGVSEMTDILDFGIPGFVDSGEDDEDEDEPAF